MTLDLQTLFPDEPFCGAVTQPEIMNKLQQMQDVSGDYYGTRTFTDPDGIEWLTVHLIDDDGEEDEDATWTMCKLSGDRYIVVDTTFKSKKVVATYPKEVYRNHTIEYRKEGYKDKYEWHCDAIHYSHALLSNVKKKIDDVLSFEPFDAWLYERGYSYASMEPPAAVQCKVLSIKLDGYNTRLVIEVNDEKRDSSTHNLFAFTDENKELFDKIETNDYAIKGFDDENELLKKKLVAIDWSKYK